MIHFISLLNPITQFMFSIIFLGSGEIFYSFFSSFSSKHRQETSGKKIIEKIMEPGNLILKHSATYYKLQSEKPNPKLLVGIKYFGVVKNVKKYFLNSNKFRTLVKN